MSRSTFAQSFNEIFDEGPIEFLTRERLRVAKHLLRTTSFPIKAIVGKIGYASPSYFSRAFHAQFGMTPTQMRKRRARTNVSLRPPGEGEAGLQREHIHAGITPKTDPIADTIPAGPETTMYEFIEGIPGCVKVLDSAAKIRYFNRHGLHAMEVDNQ